MKIGVVADDLLKSVVISTSRYSRLVIDYLSNYNNIIVYLIAYDTVVEKYKNMKIINISDALQINGLSKKIINAKKIANILDSYNLDILFCPLEHIPPYFWRTQAKKVVTIHGDAPYSIGKSVVPEMFNMKERIHRTTLRLLKSKVNRFITESESSKRGIQKGLHIKKDKISVIYHGIDLEFFNKKDRTKTSTVLKKYKIIRDYMLYVGDFRIRKNVPNMIKAYADYIKKDESKNKVNLVLAGSKNGEDYEFTKAFVEENKIEDKVIFTGYVDDGDLPYLYSGALFTLLLSLHEGFGFPLIESVACGTPVLGSDVYAIPEILKNNALLVNPVEVGNISRLIFDFSESKCLRDKYLDKQRKLLVNYNLETMGKKHKLLFEQLYSDY